MKTELEIKADIKDRIEHSKCVDGSCLMYISALEQIRSAAIRYFDYCDNHGIEKSIAGVTPESIGCEKA